MRFSHALSIAVLLVGCSDDGVPAATDGPTSATATPTTGQGSAPSDSDTADTANGMTSTDPTLTTSGTVGPSDPSTSGEESADVSGIESTGPTPQGAQRLYVSGGNAVSVWDLDGASGSLSELQRLDQGTQVGPLAHRDATYLYAARGQEQLVATLSIDPLDGTLAEIATTPVGHNPVYLSVDTTGGWLFTADFGADLVQVYPLGDDGIVGATPSENRTVQARPHAILQDPSGQHVFVPHRDANVVEQYVFDANTGTLTPNDPPSVGAPGGAGPRHMVFAPDASQAFVVNEFTSSVTVYGYDATAGNLTQGDTFSALPPDFKGDNTGADVHVTPDGAFVYASMRGHDSIAMFGVQGGALTSLGNAATQPRPREFGLSPFGDYLYAAGQDSGMLASYSVEADGTLTAGAVYDVGASPLWVLGVELPL